MPKIAIFSPLESWKAGDYPISPFLYVAVGDAPEVQGRHVLSPQLATEAEIDSVIDILAKELEQVRRFAKMELHSLQARMQAK